MIRFAFQTQRDWRLTRWALGAALILTLGPLTAPAQIAGKAEELAQLCRGPLGQITPDCQAGKASFEMPAAKYGTGGELPAIPRAAYRAAESAHPAEVRHTPEPPAQSPTEFQSFVESSIGKLLPVFGASLFEKVPTTFAPLDRIPVTADYVVGPGDEILMRVWGQVNLDLELTVDRAGAVFIPQAGNINVAGLEFQQLHGFLRAQLERVFRNFDLNVNMGQLRSIQVFIVGQARRPGSYTVSSLSTLVNALFASGGPSGQGSMRHIQLKRGGIIVTEFDLYDLFLKGDKGKDARLLPGDVVYVPPAGPQIAIAGSVKNAAIYEVNGEKTASELIQMAGGLSAVADVQRVTLERIKDRSSRQTLALRLDATGLATPVADGDLLHVLAINPRFGNAVTLRGNVANPGRFPWHAGMRLRDVIPDKDSLVTRDYWNKRNLLGYTPQEDIVAPTPGSEARQKPARTNIQFAAPEINWSYALIERQNLRDLSAELVPFHLGRLVLDKDDSQNLELRPGDVVTIFSHSDIRVATAQQRRTVRLEGEFQAAGIYAVRPGETLGQLVQRAGGMTPEAYLFGAEFLRESTRADQQRRLDEFIRDLGRAVEQTGAAKLSGAANAEETAAIATKLEGERQMVARMHAVQPTGRIVLNLEPGSNDTSKLMALPLEDGDRFVVPARPATVNVLGAVYNQNSFIHESGLRVRDYLRQSGGATRNADKDHLFIIRADGSVVPRQGSTQKAFETLRLHPGDSVVVPGEFFKTSFLRGLREWTQVFAQFALGAAAINVLR